MSYRLRRPRQLIGGVVNDHSCLTHAPSRLADFAHDCEMRLVELAYCCRIFGETTGYDQALARFVGGTGGAVNLEDPRHRALTLQWLREWGCRSLRTEDDKRSSRALKAWWAKWSAALPAVEATLDTLEEDALDAAA